MKRETDYKKMYLELLHGTEDAINTLGDCMEIGTNNSITGALRILIEAQRLSEQIYIDTCEDNLLYLNLEDEGCRKSGAMPK